MQLLTKVGQPWVIIDRMLSGLCSFAALVERSHAFTRGFCTSQQFIHDQIRLFFQSADHFLAVLSQFKQARQKIMLDPFAKLLLLVSQLRRQHLQACLHGCHGIPFAPIGVLDKRQRSLRVASAVLEADLGDLFEPSRYRFQNMVPVLETCDNNFGPIETEQ